MAPCLKFSNLRAAVKNIKEQPTVFIKANLKVIVSLCEFLITVKLYLVGSYA